MRAISADAVDELDAFLSEYADDVRALAEAAIAIVDARLPGATRMVYANWNATVVAYSSDGKTRHSVCSVATYARWVNFFVWGGAELPDPHGLLQGTGSTVRHVRLEQPGDFDDRVLDLLDAAVDRWPWKFDATRPTTTVVSGVSDKRRSRRPG